LTIQILNNIIILNTSIVIYDFWRLTVLLSSTPSMSIFGNPHRQKVVLLTNTRMIHTPMFTINIRISQPKGKCTHRQLETNDAER